MATTARDALAAYHEALHHPDLRSDDPAARTAAHDTLHDAQIAYVAAGGRVGSAYSWTLAPCCERAAAERHRWLGPAPAAAPSA